mmetsp:Transcript_26925/g.61981  ORF Transcript_26925/g.61981 Transcript_26925/m.61981 type:complete len:301 (-) Transcript_26925:1084-1986(-)
MARKKIVTLIIIMITATAMAKKKKRRKKITKKKLEEEEFNVVDADEEPDDESILIQEEKMERDMTYDEELALLQEDKEMNIESLRRKYYSEQADEKAKGTEPDTASSSSVTTASSSSSSSSEEEKEEEEEETGMWPRHHGALNAFLTASRPFLLSPWVKMREYQCAGLNWLVSLQRRRLNGILADEMGLGKTLQTISLLAYLACYKGIWGPHLVVVPTSCLVNWEVEMKRFCPALKILTYYGSAKRRKELRTGWTKINTNHVVITSYQIVVQDAFAFKRKRWYYLVLDEGEQQLDLSLTL